MTAGQGCPESSSLGYKAGDDRDQRSGRRGRKDAVHSQILQARSQASRRERRGRPQETERPKNEETWRLTHVDVRGSKSRPFKARTERALQPGHCRLGNPRQLLLLCPHSSFHAHPKLHFTPRSKHLYHERTSDSGPRTGSGGGIVRSQSSQWMGR